MTLSSVSWQHRLSAIASGFLGDWLEARRNPLALSMDFRHQGQVVTPDSPVVPDPKATLVVLIHGLMELESVWTFPNQPEDHYGSRLNRALEGGVTTLGLRYNTGRPIYRNGQQLTEALEQLVSAWPVPVQRLVLVGHSMGGLLIRSACHYGLNQGHRWLSALSDCVYVGSPHDGSWLAKGAQASAGVLNALPRDYLRVVGEVIDLRSEGIRNLSRGDVLAGEGELAALVPNARHFVVCGLLAGHARHPVNLLFGDALVHESSAQGSGQGDWILAGSATFSGIDHIRLAHHEAVAQQLVEWLS
ncbi:MAG: hypothetical protein R3175_14980 [Marinobacter sp.]|uniref:esterase/lipase family protein n=1 Tax=Marinobacter sp. TaxID=50741 RepID=UPI00299F0171|nr:hypothetical protein [Marinobacter sp.]MDX1757359.1 hypothetical protein [Marinobacter sp.]